MALQPRRGFDHFRDSAYPGTTEQYLACCFLISGSVGRLGKIAVDRTQGYSTSFHHNPCG